VQVLLPQHCLLAIFTDYNFDSWWRDEMYTVSAPAGDAVVESTAIVDGRTVRVVPLPATVTVLGDRCAIGVVVVDAVRSDAGVVASIMSQPCAWEVTCSAMGVFTDAIKRAHVSRCDHAHCPGCSVVL
jgi:hypothetical protein